MQSQEILSHESCLSICLSILCRDTDNENDGGVNNDPEVRAFLASVIKNGNGQAPRLPFQLEVSSHNPATQPAARGVEFLQLHRPFSSAGKVKIVWNCEEAALPGSAASPWQLRTTNVRRLRLYPLAGGWNTSCIPSAGLQVDSCTLPQQDVVSLLSGERHLVATQPQAASSGCRWQLSASTGSNENLLFQLQRWPEAGGPARQLSSAGPFLTVVGTGGTSSNTTDHLLAGLFLANSHALGYNTYAPMMSDTALVSHEQHQTSLSKNLLLIGGVRQNTITARWHAKASAYGKKNVQSRAQSQSVGTTTGTGLAILNDWGGVSLADGRNFSGAHTVSSLEPDPARWTS